MLVFLGLVFLGLVSVGLVSASSSTAYVITSAVTDTSFAGTLVFSPGTNPSDCKLSLKPTDKYMPVTQMTRVSSLRFTFSISEVSPQTTLDLTLDCTSSEDSVSLGKVTTFPAVEKKISVPFSMGIVAGDIGGASVSDAADYGRLIGKAMNESLLGYPSVLTLPRSLLLLDSSSSSISDTTSLLSFSSSLTSSLRNVPLVVQSSSSSLQQLFPGYKDVGFSLGSVRFIQIPDPRQLDWSVLEVELTGGKDYLALVVVSRVPWPAGWSGSDRTAFANMVRDLDVRNLAMVTGGTVLAADGGNGTDFALPDGGAGFPVFAVGPVNGVSVPSDEASFDQGCLGYTGSKTTQFGLLLFTVESKGNFSNVCFLFVGHRLQSSVALLRSQKCRSVKSKPGVGGLVDLPYSESWLVNGRKENQKIKCELPALPPNQIAAIAFSATLAVALVLAAYLYFMYRRYKVYKKRLRIATNLQYDDPTGSQQNIMMVGEAATNDRLADLAAATNHSNFNPSRSSVKKQRRGSVMQERDAAEIFVASMDAVPEAVTRGKKREAKRAMPKQQDSSLSTKEGEAISVPPPTYNSSNSRKYMTRSGSTIQAPEQEPDIIINTAKSNMVKSESSRSLRSIRSAGSMENLVDAANGPGKIRKIKQRTQQ